jgi:hypothetical protein
MLGASILTFWGFQAPCQRHIWYSHDNALNGDLTDILSAHLEQRWDFGHFPFRIHVSNAIAIPLGSYKYFSNFLFTLYSDPHF